MAIIETGSNTAGTGNVDANYNLQVVQPGTSATGVDFGGGHKNGPAIFSEIDAGYITATRDTLSPEVDNDYRLRVAHDNMMDQELFNYSLQNTAKHGYAFTTLTSTIGTSGITTNSGNVTTTTTGLTFGTFAQFPVGGTQTTVCETSVAFSAQPNANTIIDFGLFQRGATTAFAPLDGVYFRMSSAGLQGVINRAGAEVTTNVFPLSLNTGTFVYTNNTVYRFLIQVNNVNTTFWINNVKYGSISTPIGLNFPCASIALPWSFRHAIVGGTAGAITQALFSDYRVFVRGENFDESLGTVSNRVMGSYQTMSGVAPTALIAGTVTAGTLVKPTAAVPLNASLAANLPNNLGGRIYETLTTGLAANVDGIYASYQVPAGTFLVPGRRLRVNGIKLSGMVSTVVVGGPAYTEWYIAFGHNISASLANTESASMATATSKAPRRIMLPGLTTNMTAAQAAGTALIQPVYAVTFINPIYVNPGEFIQLVGNKTITTAITSGILSYMYQFDYSWE